MKTFALSILLLFVTFMAPAASGQSQQTMTIKLFFPNTKLDKADCAVKVFPVTRTIPKTAAVARGALEQLFAGPTSQEKAKGFYSDFSEDTKSFFFSVNVKNRAAYVNLGDPTLTPTMGNFTTSCGGSNFFGQVEKTLKQFPSIKTVFYAIKGDPSVFYDWMQIGECPKELKDCDSSNFIK
jgi:spore germination protein GerM